MKKDKEGYDLHVLVCTNEKKHGGGCGPKGGQAVVDALKAWSKSDALDGKKVRINKSGCLGRCDEGIVCVAYANNEWVIEATPADVPAIEAWIKGMVSGK